MMYAGLARNAGEVEAALHLAATTFVDGQPKSRQLELKTFLTLENPRVSPQDFFVLVQRTGQVIGCLVLVNRIVPRDGFEIPVTHLTSVCIDQKWRSKGLSRLLMEAALEECRRRGAALALLVARRSVDHFYNKFGFWGISSYSQIVHHNPSGVRVSVRLRSMEVSDLTFCSRVYDQQYKNCFGHHLRSAEDWTFLFRKLTRQGDKLFIIEDNYGPQGYMIASAQRVYEIAALEASRGNEALALYRSGLQVSHLNIDLPAQHPIAKSAGTSVISSSRECRYGGHMAAIVDRELLARTAELRIAARATKNRFRPQSETLDGINYVWDGKSAKVSIIVQKMGFKSASRLLGADQLSLKTEPPVLDPMVPFNLFLADQI